MYLNIKRAEDDYIVNLSQGVTSKPNQGFAV